MPQPRKFATPALRQRAYRARKRAALASYASNPATAPARPGPARWKALLTHAELLLQTAQREMERYFEERSENWQESERGETFLERIENLEIACGAIQDAL